MHVGLRAGPRRVAARRRWASAARTSPRRRGLRLAYSHPLRRAFPPVDGIAAVCRAALEGLRSGRLLSFGRRAIGLETTARVA